jgi:Na+-transporting NADH:ubiquinone oxidoreductase subunit E
MPLTLFLGLCTFLALSKRPRRAWPRRGDHRGSGVTVPLNHLIYDGLLAPGAWAWAGLPELDLSYLSLIAFIGVIAATVQVLEMVLDRFFPAIHAAFGVFLPLLTVQCAILGRQPLHGRTQLHAGGIGVFGLGSGVGFAVAVVMLGAIRSRLAYADLPAGCGVWDRLHPGGLMSLGFASFAQMAATQ